MLLWVKVNLLSWCFTHRRLLSSVPLKSRRRPLPTLPQRRSSRSRWLESCLHVIGPSQVLVWHHGHHVLASSWTRQDLCFFPSWMHLLDGEDNCMLSVPFWDNPDAAGLVEALRKARSQASRPVGERLDKTLLFVERAKKRLASAEEVLMNAMQVKSTRERELQDGLDRLKRLREEAAAQTAAAPQNPTRS